MSMPISRMASIANGFTRAAGSVPALKVSTWRPAFARSRPSAIWLRAELPVQRNKTIGRAIESPWRQMGLTARTKALMNCPWTCLAAVSASMPWAERKSRASPMS